MMFKKKQEELRRHVLDNQSPGSKGFKANEKV